MHVLIKASGGTQGKKSGKGEGVYRPYVRQELGQAELTQARPWIVSAWGRNVLTKAVR